jgi:hypothetical protein
MGALIVVLLLVSQRAKAMAIENSAHVSAREQQIAELELLELRGTQLQQQRERTQADLATRRMELGQIEDHMRTLQVEFNDLCSRLSRGEEVNSTADDVQAELARTEQSLADAREALTRAQNEQAHQEVSYSIIPYEGPHGTRRRPIYIECRRDAVVIQPEGIVFTVEDFMGPSGPGNPLAAAMRATREHHAEAVLATGTKQPEPYPLLLVRPDGVVAYGAARAALKSWDTEFGYELIEGDWKLSFEPADPILAEIAQKAADTARIRQAELMRSAPRIYGKRAGSRGTNQDFASAEAELNGGGPGSGSAGGGSRGAGSGGVSGGPGMGRGEAGGGYGDGRGGGSGLADGDGTGIAGGYGGAGNGRGGDGTGDNTEAAGQGPGFGRSEGDSGGDGTGFAGGSSDTQDGNGLAGGEAGGSGNGTGLAGGGTAGGGDANNPGKLADSKHGGRGGNARHGSGTVGGSGFDSGAGDSSEGSEQSGPALEGSSLGESVGGSNGQPGGTRRGGGGRRYGADAPGEAAYGGEGGLVDGTSGSRRGGPAAHPGDGQSGESASGASDDVAQNKPGYWSEQSTGGRRSSGGVSTQWSGQSGDPSGMSGGPGGTSGTSGGVGSDPSSGSGAVSMSAQPTRPLPASMAQRRGTNWGLPEKAVNAVPITRPIRLQCHTDRLVLLPSTLTNSGSKEIYWGDQTDGAVDELVSKVWEQMKGWGMAGNGMYWKPVLSCEVAPEARWRYEELAALLAESGLDVREKPTAPPAVRHPRRSHGLKR